MDLSQDPKDQRTGRGKEGKGTGVVDCLNPIRGDSRGLKEGEVGQCGWSVCVRKQIIGGGVWGGRHGSTLEKI